MTTVAHQLVDRRGLSILEVIIAISILAAVLISLSGIMYSTTKQAKASVNATNRAAALLTSSSLAQGLPYDTIPVYATGCSAKTAGSFTYDLCFTYQDTANFRRVKVIVVPTGTGAGAPETLYVDRAKPSVRAATLNMH
jgi:Tfp pilus assembly protein PilV